MKSFIDKILDAPKLVFRIWIILWLILIILLILKFCFGIWYPIICNIEWFNNLCYYIDNHDIVSKSIMFVFYVLSSNILLFICIGKTKYSKWYYMLILNLVFIGMFLSKFIHNSLGIISEISVILACIIYNIKKDTFKNKIVNILLPIIFYILLNLWQLTMLLIRGTSSFKIDELPNLISYILQIDYYIFLIITWIEVSFMGLFSWGWFWSKDITVLKAEKEKELAKKNPDLKKVAKIDSKISELAGK